MSGQWAPAAVARHFKAVHDFMDGRYAEATCDMVAFMHEPGDRHRAVPVKKGELWTWRAIDDIARVELKTD